MPRASSIGPGMRVMSNVGVRPSPVKVSEAAVAAAQNIRLTERTEPVPGLTEGISVHYVGTAPRHYAGVVVDVLDPVSGLALVSVYRKDDGRPVAVRSYYEPTGRLTDTWHFLTECQWMQ